MANHTDLRLINEILASEDKPELSDKEKFVIVPCLIKNGVLELFTDLEFCTLVVLRKEDFESERSDEYVYDRLLLEFTMRELLEGYKKAILGD